MCCLLAEIVSVGLIDEGHGAQQSREESTSLLSGGRMARPQPGKPVAIFMVKHL